MRLALLCRTALLCNQYRMAKNGQTGPVTFAGVATQSGMAWSAKLGEIGGQSIKILEFILSSGFGIHHKKIFYVERILYSTMQALIIQSGIVLILTLCCLFVLCRKREEENKQCRCIVTEVSHQILCTLTSHIQIVFNS